jgi:2-octaprenylphenol hydroxylase
VESALSRLSEQAGQQVLHLADGRQLKTRLLIGADGVDSAVRRHLAIETSGHSYGQKALVAHLSTEHAHANTAWQRFLSSGPLAFLPLSDGRSSIVWSIEEARAAELLQLDQEGFGKAVTEASDKVLGECRLTSSLASFPLHLKYALEYVRPGAVLLGDAAHAVHPLAGQGLNLGLEDVATLIEVLIAVSEEEWGDLRTLRRYERRRKSDNALAMIGLDGLERLFVNADGFATALRRVGLGAVERLPLLKRRLAMTALGL